MHPIKPFATPYLCGNVHVRTKENFTEGRSVMRGKEMNVLLRMKDLTTVLGLCKASIYLKIKRGVFPGTASESGIARRQMFQMVKSRATHTQRSALIKEYPISVEKLLVAFRAFSLVTWYEYQ